MLYFMLVRRVEEEEEERKTDFASASCTVGRTSCGSQGLGGSTSPLSGSEQYLCGEVYEQVAV